MFFQLGKVSEVKGAKVRGVKGGAQASGSLKGQFLIVSSLRFGSEHCGGGKLLSQDSHTRLIVSFVICQPMRYPFFGSEHCGGGKLLSQDSHTRLIVSFVICQPMRYPSCIYFLKL